MPDETVSALQEIASLLRRRIEQQEEMAQRSEERMAKLDERKSHIPALEKIQEDSKQRLTQMKAQFEQRDEHKQAEKEKLQQEDREFKQRLLAELERHNSLLEQLLSRLTQ